MPISYSQKQQEDVRVGDIVERDIDGILFPAKIMGVRRTDCKDYRSSTTYDLKYLDDNNCEDEVPEDEIRRVLDERKRENLIRLSTAKHEGDASGGVDDGSEGGLPTKAEDKTTGGDVWDGIESSRATFVGPKVTIHSSHGTFDAEEDGSATAYIINGPETNIAAGSGLRGIRWLRG